MVAELFPECYDVQGHRVFRPSSAQRRSGFRPTFPMGRYLTQPLKYKCSDFAEMRRFLAGCRYSGRHRRGKNDYWQPPEEFEETKIGDCADFALWCWRQLLAMGHPTRFVGGRAGKFGEGHAWVTFEKDGKFYMLEPQSWPVGVRMPRISTLRYHPLTSVAWDGEKISYYAHDERKTEPPFGQVPVLVGEWLFVWTWFWARVISRIPRAVARQVFRRPAERPAATPE